MPSGSNDIAFRPPACVAQTSACATTSLSRNHSSLLKQFVGAPEVDLSVKVEGGQVGIRTGKTWALRPQMDLGQPCTHRNLTRIAAQVQGWKGLGSFPDFSRRGAPLFVEESPDGVGAPAGTRGQSLTRVYRDHYAARRAAIETGIGYLLFGLVQELPWALRPLDGNLIMN